MMATNDITVTILESGAVRIDTDAISGPSHQIAEKALAWIAAEMGGEVAREARTDIKHAHNHAHAHEHNGVWHSH